MAVEKSCGVIIFCRGSERRYLLLKYGWSHWGFVKGKTEEGEVEMQTATREAEEETGLEKGWLHFIPPFKEKINYFYTREGGKIYKEVTYFLAECRAEAADRIRLSHEHTDYAWLFYDDAIGKITYENDRKILENVEMFLNE